MKKIYISYDVVAEEIIDAFVRKNDEAAKRDFIKAFRMQSSDRTHSQVYEAYPTTTDNELPLENIEGIPVKLVWDSKEFEDEENKQLQNEENK